MNRFLVPFLLLTIAIKVAAVLAQGPSPIDGDALGYWNLSSRVLQGDWLMMGEPIAYRTPVYPWMLAAIRWVSPWPLPTLIALQGVLYMATVCITAQLGETITGQPRAKPIVLLFSLPMLSAITFAATMLTETLFIFLLMLHLLSVVCYSEHPTRWRALLVAASFAVLLLTRPIVILMWVADVVFIVVMLWPRKGSPHRSSQPTTGIDGASAPRSRLGLFGHFAIAALTMMLLLSPWLIRNQRLFGKPMLTEFVGRNLWIVTFQDGSGAGLPLPDSTESETLLDCLVEHSESTDTSVPDQWRLTWSVSDALVDSGMSDPEADRLMRSVAKQAVKTSPVVFAQKAVRRVVNFWRTAATDLPPQGDDPGQVPQLTTWDAQWSFVDAALARRWSRWVWGNSILLFAMIMSVGILIWKRPTRWHGVWLAAVLLYFCLVTGILEIPAYRYRIVVEPLVLLVCSMAVTTLLTRDADHTASSATHPVDPATETE
ncbi:ArnT family glycosyltransferase [Stieleria varia]|uniref:Glycosyltransferase RgtA/B/C/D-like domain-containing protein n=1 Tax=Stieleria varia TaxID=2528005 RepID=A0A5C5ZLW8_9BACT|nr:hypothetical protein [Stieleria varia]TWT87977.1 hypothetical protein Pla52n_69340 [Stieleria varia]